MNKRYEYAVFAYGKDGILLNWGPLQRAKKFIEDAGWEGLEIVRGVCLDQRVTYDTPNGSAECFYARHTERCRLWLGAFYTEDDVYRWRQALTEGRYCEDMPGRRNLHKLNFSQER